MVLQFRCVGVETNGLGVEIIANLFKKLQLVQVWEFSVVMEFSKRNCRKMLFPWKGIEGMNV